MFYEYVSEKQYAGRVFQLCIHDIIGLYYRAEDPPKITAENWEQAIQWRNLCFFAKSI